MMEERAEAVEWAESVVKNLKVAEIDRPYMVAVLVEAALIESPVHPLDISINPDGTKYSITIKGYKGLVDMEEFVLIFRGENRHHHLTRVRRIYIQTPPGEGAYYIIEMDAGQWQNNHHRREMPKRRAD